MNTKKLVATNVSGKTDVNIPAQGSVVLVLVPSDQKMNNKDGKLYAGQVVVDYRYKK